MTKKQKNILISIVMFIGIVFIYKFINKDSLIGVIFQTLPPREAALMAGMVFGDKNNFDKQTYYNFLNSGVIHIMVVSGTNMMLVFRGLVERMAGWVGRKRAIIFGFGVSLIYLNWVGWEVPVLRAFLMMTIFYWAQMLGRKFNLVRTMILIILIMVVADYRVLIGGSFYLSFVAFGAITMNFFKERKWWSDLWNSFWVNLWIFPILVLFFGKISLISPITNALILFLVEIVTILGILGGLVGLVVPILGKLILWISLPLLKYILYMVDGVAGITIANMEIKFNWVWMVGWYLILIWILFKKSHYKFIKNTQ